MTRRARNSRAERRHRVLVLAALVVYAGLSLQVGLHRILEDHRICATHGELTHSGEAVAPEVDDDVAALLAREGEDEHCASVHTKPDAVRPNLFVVTSERIRGTVPHVVRLDAGGVVNSANDPLRVAPKQSPPV